MRNFPNWLVGFVKKICLSSGSSLFSCLLDLGHDFLQILRCRRIQWICSEFWLLNIRFVMDLVFVIGLEKYEHFWFVVVFSEYGLYHDA